MVAIACIYLTYVCFEYAQIVEREILEKFDHPFIMGLEFAF